jgi:hypothetical protein
MSQNLPLRHLTCENKINTQSVANKSGDINSNPNKAKTFLELNSVAIHFVSSCWIKTKYKANESHKKSF